MSFVRRYRAGFALVSLSSRQANMVKQQEVYACHASLAFPDLAYSSDDRRRAKNKNTFGLSVERLFGVSAGREDICVERVASYARCQERGHGRAEDVSRNFSRTIIVFVAIEERFLLFVNTGSLSPAVREASRHGTYVSRETASQALHYFLS